MESLLYKSSKIFSSNLDLGLDKINNLISKIKEIQVPDDIEPLITPNQTSAKLETDEVIIRNSKEDILQLSKDKNSNLKNIDYILVPKVIEKSY